MAKRSPTPLLGLPNEILLLIAECLVEFRDLYAFLRANRLLAILLAEPSYRLAARSSLHFAIDALLWAAASQNEPMLRVVLSASSFRITVKNQRGQVLCLVSQLQTPDANAVARILAERAAIRICIRKGRRTSCERPALHWAAGTGNRALIRLLLDKGADIDAQDRYGQTALHCAAAMNREAAIKTLLRRGADRYVFSSFGETPLDRAMYYQHFDVVMMLLEGARISATYQYARTALHLAAGYPVDDVAATVVRSLLKKGADLAALATAPGQDCIVITPISNAIFRGNEKVVKVLLDAGGWRNQPEHHDRIIETALEEKHYQIARLLLEAAPVGYLSETYQCTLLHMAIGLPSADVALVKLLLDKGTPINAHCVSGTTPLHHAVQHGYVGIVELLLERGANIHALDFRVSNALIYAAAGIPWSPDGTYVLQGDRGTTGSMLHIAELLLERGADIDAQDIDDRTPMHHAVIAGGMAMVTLLLRFEPNLDLVDSGWRTPVEVARAKNTGGYEEAEIFKLLQAVTGRAGWCSCVGG